jgi:glyoxylate carboligase
VISHSNNITTSSESDIANPFNSKAQYEDQLKKWDMRKNLKASEWKYIAHRIQKRKREGLESDIYFNDTPIPPKKIKKEVSRHSIPTYISGMLNIIKLIFGPWY